MNQKIGAPNIHLPGTKRIVLTGGPGAGKTTAADLFGPIAAASVLERVATLPEVATLLYSGGFPRVPSVQGRQAIQRAIYHVQRNLEDVQSHLNPSKIFLCDRGTLDGAGYWPEGPNAFLEDVKTTLELEFARYDTVVFFETAAVGGLEIDRGNPVRNESIQDAIALDRKLRGLWSQHPHFILIPHQVSFINKLDMASEVLRSLIFSADPTPGAASYQPVCVERGRVGTPNVQPKGI